MISAKLEAGMHISIRSGSPELFAAKPLHFARKLSIKFQHSGNSFCTDTATNSNSRTKTLLTHGFLTHAPC
jgi:adenine deaminase